MNFYWRKERSLRLVSENEILRLLSAWYVNVVDTDSALAMSSVQRSVAGSSFLKFRNNASTHGSTWIISRRLYCEKGLWRGRWCSRAKYHARRVFSNIIRSEMAARVRACIYVDKARLTDVIKLETRGKALVIPTYTCFIMWPCNDTECAKRTSFQTSHSHCRSNLAEV